MVDLRAKVQCVNKPKDVECETTESATLGSRLQRSIRRSIAIDLSQRLLVSSVRGCCCSGARFGRVSDAIDLVACLGSFTSPPLRLGSRSALSGSRISPFSPPPNLLRRSYFGWTWAGIKETVPSFCSVSYFPSACLTSGAENARRPTTTAADAVACSLPLELASSGIGEVGGSSLAVS